MCVLSAVHKTFIRCNCYTSLTGILQYASELGMIDTRILFAFSVFSSTALLVNAVQGLPLFGFVHVMSRHAVGILGRGIDPAQGLRLYRTQQETSVPRVGFEPTILVSSGRGQYAP
jgi:hypothetical protein